MMCRMINQPIEIDGQEKLISWRYEHSGMSLEALIECGVFLFCAYRYMFFPLMHLICFMFLY
jgi:hypothetical protein